MQQDCTDNHFFRLEIKLAEYQESESPTNPGRTFTQEEEPKDVEEEESEEEYEVESEEEEEEKVEKTAGEEYEDEEDELGDLIQEKLQITSLGKMNSNSMTPSKKKNSSTPSAEEIASSMARLELRIGGEIISVDNIPGFITKFGEGMSTIVAIDLLAYSGTATNLEGNPTLGYYEIKISKCGNFADVLFYYPLFILDPAWLTAGHPLYFFNSTRIQSLQDMVKIIKEKFKQVRPHTTTRIRLPCPVRQNPRWSGCLCYPGNEQDDLEESLIQMVSFEFVVLDDDIGTNKVMNASIIKMPKPDPTTSGGMHGRRP